MLNTDLKLISKTLAARLKNMLPDLISSNQTAYVKNRYIIESGRLIYDVLETASILHKKGFLVTVDKRLLDRNFHNWKIIPLFLFEKHFGKNFKFHGSLDIPQYHIKKMPEFCREILLNWSKFLSYDHSVPSTILSRYLWFNKQLK